MAIIDGLQGAWIAKAGQASPYDEVNGQFASAGTITATLALEQDPTEDYHWNYANGGYAIFPVPSNGGARVGNENCTFAVRFRVQTRGNDNDVYVQTTGSGGNGGSNGLRVLNNGTATGNIRIEWRYGSGSAAGAVSVPYTTGNIITIVSRGDAFTNGGSGTHEVFVDGGVGVTPDASASFGAWSNFSNTEAHFIIYATEEVDVFEHAFWNELKTPTECRALATDLRGELETALGAANLAPTETSPIGTINATVGVALNFDLNDHFSDDGDVLSFSVNGGGTALPAWASISSRSIVGTPTSGDVGTTSGHVLDFTDGVNPPDQSTAFSITVSNLPRIVTAPMATGAASVLSSTSGITVDVYNITTGALVLHLTNQTTESDGTLIISNAALSDATQYVVVTRNTATGEPGVRIYTAAIP